MHAVHLLGVVIPMISTNKHYYHHHHRLQNMFKYNFKLELCL